MTSLLKILQCLPPDPPPRSQSLQYKPQPPWSAPQIVFHCPASAGLSCHCSPPQTYWISAPSSLLNCCSLRLSRALAHASGLFISSESSHALWSCLEAQVRMPDEDSARHPAQPRARAQRWPRVCHAWVSRFPYQICLLTLGPRTSP